VLAGLVPVIGGVMMGFIFVKAWIVESNPDYNYSQAVLGIQMPILIGIGSLLLGIPLMFLCWVKLRPYFRRKTEVAPPGII
jgi:hypothetical protein